MGATASVSNSVVRNSMENLVSNACTSTARCTQRADIGRIVLDNVTMTGTNCPSLIDQNTTCVAQCSSAALIDAVNKMKANASSEAGPTVGLGLSATNQQVENAVKNKIDQQCKATSLADQAANIGKILVKNSTIDCHTLSIAQNSNARALCELSATLEAVNDLKTDTSAASGLTTGGIMGIIGAIVGVIVLVVVIKMLAGGSSSSRSRGHSHREHSDSDDEDWDGE